MASADLEYIRALLIAQTAEPEPEAKGGLLGRWLPSKRARRPAPLNLEPPRARANLDQRGEALGRAPSTDPDQELLLETICGPAPMAEARAMTAYADVPPPLVGETIAPLPPPAPRAEFGRRADLVEELMLDQPAGEMRRLRVLGPAGQAIGEMILHAGSARDDLHAVPFFPEDLMEPPAPTGPQPMRPWIKSLRNSGKPQADAPVVETPVEAMPEPASAQKPAKVAKPRRARAREKTAAAPPPPMPRAPKTPGLDRDLMEALCLTLTREHDMLADRLTALSDEALFE